MYVSFAFNATITAPQEKTTTSNCIFAPFKLKTCLEFIMIVIATEKMLNIRTSL